MARGRSIHDLPMVDISSSDFSGVNFDGVLKRKGRRRKSNPLVYVQQHRAATASQEAHNRYLAILFR